MAAEFGITCNLWDFAADEGRLLERIVGEVGIDHIVVPAVTGPRTAFRVLAQPDAPAFHTDGGWHFRTSVKAYANVALRPRKARWFATGDLVAQLRQRAADLGIRVLARVDLRAVRQLVDDQPHVAQRNAWGQEAPSAGACASNADVRELLRATLEDLSRYALAGYELRDWAPDHAVDHHDPRPYDWSPPVRRLLDICFCASCRQIAERGGVDGEAAARSARVRVEKLLANGTPPTTDEADDPVLSAYLGVRAADSAAWLKRLAESEPERRRLLVRDFGEPPLGSTAPWVPMLRLMNPRVAPIADDTWWSVFEPQLERISALSIPAWRPTFPDGATLVRRVHRAAELGVSVIDFENVTEAPDDAIDWLKQAVRYARRSQIVPPVVS